MDDNVNTMEKTGKGLDIAAGAVDGIGQGTDSPVKKTVDLLSLNAGEIFIENGVEYIVLEQLGDSRTAVLRKEILEDAMKFDSDNNNWKTSSIRRFLNEDYLREIEEAFGKDNIVEHTVNLLSLDGLDDYGTSNDRVSLLTIDQYRKYRRVIQNNLDSAWWLITPDSTPSGYGASCVQCVASGGGVGCGGCRWSLKGVRPFFILQS